MEARSLRMKYLEAIKQIDQLKDYPVLTNEDGKIILGGRRWILMDVEAFPSYMIKTASNLMGEKLAQEFVYWFGLAYGEKVAERYQKVGIPNDKIIFLLPMIISVTTGWGVAEIVEYSPQEGRLVAKLYNDFESESAILNGEKPTNNFLRGVLAGIFAKLWNVKVRTSTEFKDGYTLVTVTKR
ncbi:hypothetical protein MA03_08395 [Infirmifilum uzonense]|uniref:4-vinyl reductase 4VR domain-containing protein n=1 Tax=Infirmifilum uzonense TaxID=1550241 RepID=A0A0F7FIJ3_9CREN|nr:hypothetical protein [Infirmifilum uzonense]AKG39239.1 hypothetical protein MA03_08395 [Infirmifilum uzonense]